ncbi:citrate lyase subunit alpha [Aminobacterium mobile]|uniref:citrate lyase subunit alpha n=1 Tax=Aminobacterium mobile TaxID=81467 RepID=UPI003315F3C6
MYHGDFKGKKEPGETEDVPVTDRVMAVNPLRGDLQERLEKANLPVEGCSRITANIKKNYGKSCPINPRQKGGWTSRILRWGDHRHYSSSFVTFSHKEHLQGGYNEKRRNLCTSTGSTSSDERKSSNHEQTSRGKYGRSIHCLHSWRCGTLQRN